MFNRAMAEGSLRVGRALAQVYDFSPFKSVMDAGGGYGALLVGLLEARPGRLEAGCSTCRPCAGHALTYLGEQGVGGRVDYTGGSFFEAVPDGDDCLLLKFILHDWNDARCRTILTNIRRLGDGRRHVAGHRADRAGNRISRPTPTSSAATSSMMSVGGKERTEAQYRSLLGEAGLRIARVVAIDGNFSAIEARAS